MDARLTAPQGASHNINQVRIPRYKARSRQQHSPVSLIRSGQCRSALRACYRCGDQHLQQHCRFNKADCYNSGKKGAIFKVFKRKSNIQQDHYVLDKQENSEGITVYDIADAGVDSSVHGIELSLQRAVQALVMILDTGASPFIVAGTLCNPYLRNLSLNGSSSAWNVQGRGYSLHGGDNPSLHRGPTSMLFAND